MRIPTETRQSPGVSHTVGEVRMENPALKGSSQEDEMVVGFDALDSQKPKGFKGKMTIECPTEFQTIHRNQSKTTIQRSQGSLRLRSFQGFVLVLRLPSVMHQSTRRSKFNNHWEQTHGFLLKWGTSGFFFAEKNLDVSSFSPIFRPHISMSQRNVLFSRYSADFAKPIADTSQCSVNHSQANFG